MRRSVLIAMVVFGTGCGGADVSDRDGDGIPDRFEAEFGTEVGEADSDGDGIPDAREVAPFGSDPEDPLSWPYGVWPDFSADAVVEDPGYRIGQQLPDLQLLDAEGQPVGLHQFYGLVVLLDFAAGWCPSCRGEARTAEDLYQEHREDGFVIVNLMTESTSGPPTETFLRQWRDEFDLTFPVVQEEGNPTLQALADAGVYDNGVPFFVVLDRELRIRSASSTQDYMPALEAALEAP